MSVIEVLHLYIDQRDTTLGRQAIEIVVIFQRLDFITGMRAHKHFDR